MARTTQAQLDGVARNIAASLGIPAEDLYWEHSVSLWTLYRDHHPGASRIVFGATASEAWGRAHSYWDGILAGTQALHDAQATA